MKRARRCPKCAGEKILHIAEVHNSSSSSSKTIADASWGNSKVAGTVMGLPPGALEAWFCGACGFVEYYVRDPGAVVVDGHAVRR
jgi:hypothetical protein